MDSTTQVSAVFSLKKTLANGNFNMLSSGRLYDDFGNYRPWWTNKTAFEYEKRTECFVEQYKKFRIPELHANVCRF
jgi:predicted metalloendopeptidase